MYDAKSKLREHCINSGYNQGLVEEILVQADTLDRLLTPRIKDNADANLRIIRWVIFSGISYEKCIHQFTSKLNYTSKNHGIKLEIVKSTGSCIGQLLFNNKVKSMVPHICVSG